MSDAVEIKVAWPQEAKRDDWRIAQVLAIDHFGNLHVMEIVGATMPIRLTARTVGKRTD